MKITSSWVLAVRGLSPEKGKAFWPRRIALELNAYLLTHPLVPIQSWFEARTALRLREMEQVNDG